MIEDLPNPIKNHILAKVNNEYKASPNTFNVTELLYCLRKAYFHRLNPKPLALKAAWYIYRGELLDEVWTPLFRRYQVRCTYRCKSVPVAIVGKFDFLDENGVLTDLKTTKNLYYVDEPKPEHVKQVRFYAWCNAVPKAQLIYADFGDAKVFPVEVGDCSDLLEELEGKALCMYLCLKKEKPPEAFGPEWLCRICEYRDDCKSDSKIVLEVRGAV